MAKIWCSISSHGYGHAAQVIPILNELSQGNPDLQVILRTMVPRQFFEHKLQVNWVLQEMQQDVGCLQQGPLDIDVEGTWEAYRQFHQCWPDALQKEADAIRASEVDLVMANISHLGIAAGTLAGLPTVAVASLCWDQILLHLAPIRADWQHKIFAEIQSAYAQASHLIRLYPGIDMPAFSSFSTAGPSCLTLPPPTTDIRKLLHVRTDDRIVLVAFGGIPLEPLPLEALEELTGFHFVVSGVQVPKSFTRISSWETLHVPFSDILQQADVVMTKPGYSTIVTAVHYGMPLVYVRRDNFAEEGNLVAYAQEYGRAFELSRTDFEAGEWRQVLTRAMERPRPTAAPPQDGARDAAHILKTFLLEK